MIPLSKQADIDIPFWNEDAGPLENIFDLGAKGMFILSGGWFWTLLFIMEQVFGWGADDVGRKFDEMLGLKNLDDLIRIDENQAARQITKELYQEAKASQDHYVKTAGLGLARMLTRNKFLSLISLGLSSVKKLLTGTLLKDKGSGDKSGVLGKLLRGGVVGGAGYLANEEGQNRLLTEHQKQVNKMEEMSGRMDASLKEIFQE